MDTIPNNWQLIKIKYLFDEFFGGSWGFDPVSSQITGLVKVIRVSEFEMNTLGLKDKISTLRSLDLDESSPKLVRKNDLILEKSGGGEKTAVGRVILIDKDIKFPTVNSNFTNLCRPNNLVDPRFLVFSLNELYMRGVTKKNIKQTTGIQNLDIQGFTNEKIFIPPLKEQALISRYLDKKNQIINSLLEKLEKKIKLLKEQKIVIINQLVTKGLDPNVEMKDSGNEWIGEIPKHWKSSKLKFVSKIFGRIGYRGYTVEDIVEEDNGCITLGPGNILNSSLNLDSRTFLSWEKYYESPEIQIFNGDVIFVKTGSTIGKSCLVKNIKHQMTINPQIVVFKNLKIDPEYLFHQSICPFFQSFFKTESAGGSTPTISQEKIKDFKILIPPREEQLKLSEEINKYVEKNLSLETKFRKKIKLLQEYRQALISSVVTGKIRITEDMF